MHSNRDYLSGSRFYLFFTLWASIAILFFISMSPITAQTPPPTSDILASEPLKWAPPELENPITIDLPPDYPGWTLKLEIDQDYIIQMPNEPLKTGLSINNGRNIVMIGGEIDIPWMGDEASISDRRALILSGMTGIVHIEGLLIHGEDLTEGIQIDAPDAIVQLQNVGIFGVHARDEVEFTDNHPDLIQSYGSVGELRVDRFTGSTDYQGFFFSADFNGAHGGIDLSHVNIIGLPTARYLIWFSQTEWKGDVKLEDVWVDVPEERSGGLGDAVWPPTHHDFPDRAEIITNADCICVGWPPEMIPHITGFVQQGTPPDGDFVRAENIGTHYISPGYIGKE